VRFHVALQLLFHYVRASRSASFPQLAELRRRQVASLSGQHLFSRNIYDHQFIGRLNKTAGTLFAARLPVMRSTASCSSLTCCRLNGGHHIDSGGKDLLHILPSVSVAPFRRVLPCQFVDQADLGTTVQNSLHIDHRRFTDNRRGITSIS